MQLPDTASEDITVPFSIAFQDDMYFPYTMSAHKFGLYKQPKLIDVYPDEIQVGKLTEVYITADENDPFWLRKYLINFV